MFDAGFLCGILIIAIGAFSLILLCDLIKAAWNYLR